MTMNLIEQLKKYFHFLRNSINTSVQKTARLFGVEVSRYKPICELAVVFQSLLVLRGGLATSNNIDASFLNYCQLNYKNSRSQLFQDLCVQFLLQDKRNGYFVEFGATDGISLSNTYLLEKEYGWQGILAEPAQCWQQSLRENRSSKIDSRCVWSETGYSLEFNETIEAELSTINNFSSRDLHSVRRLGGKKYVVQTVSLNDLLDFHNAPKDIDYLSIDTEGSEFVILSNFDFYSHNINIITVEHNFSHPDRENMHSLLISKGYKRIFERFSQWDDWYVKNTFLHS